MKKIFLVFTVSSLLCIGCIKDKNIDPRKPVGKVVDATTNVPLPYASVALIEVDHSNWNTTYTLIAATTANANGEFSFNNTLNKDLSYMFSAKKDEYFETTTSEYVEIKSSFTVVPLKPKAYLKLEIKNTNGIYDEISIGYPVPGTFYGMTVDTSVAGEVYYGNSNISFTWFLYTGGNLQNTQSVNVYCTAFDTTLYQINY